MLQAAVEQLVKILVEHLKDCPSAPPLAPDYMSIMFGVANTLQQSIETIVKEVDVINRLIHDYMRYVIVYVHDPATHDSLREIESYHDAIMTIRMQFDELIADLYDATQDIVLFVTKTGVVSVAERKAAWFVTTVFQKYRRTIHGMMASLALFISLWNTNIAPKIDEEKAVHSRLLSLSEEEMMKAPVYRLPSKKEKQERNYHI